MNSVRAPLTSLLLVAGATGCFAACSAYDTPLPPTPQVVVAAKPPPAISGGTLIMAKNGLAVAADSDRDRVFAVDLTSNKKVAEIALEEGDEPGRLAEDGQGLIHVALRNGGGVATIDIAAGEVVARTPVCAAPRGLAYQASEDAILVACAGGELATLKGGKVTQTLHLDSDLRDVIVQEGEVFVSRFRNAELLKISLGAVQQRVTLLPFANGAFDENGNAQSFEPEVAWKMIPMNATKSIAMVHQRAMTTPVKIHVEGGYSGGGGGCGNTIVQGTVSVFHRGTPYTGSENGDMLQPMVGAPLFGSVLPVDAAVDEGNSRIAVVSAGSGTVVISSTFDFENQGDGCGFNQTPAPVVGTPVAVAWSPTLGKFVAQTREPAGIVVLDETGNPATTIDAGGESVADTGHQMFHTNPGGLTALACASCHPEGRDDGRVWNFDPIGARRTPTLGGGVLQTAPLHWDGDMSGLDMIMDEVFVKRMGGQVQGPRKIKAFSAWIDALPTFKPNAVVDAEAVARGKALFEDQTVGCSGCHSGPRYTNNLAKDVGTGQAFQVPPLMGLASRAPYMHDGCAATLKDRFSPTIPGNGRDNCGGTKHGDVSKLDEAQIDDLVAFLETL